MSWFVRNQLKREITKPPSDDIQCDSFEEEAIGENTSDTSSYIGNNKSTFHKMRVFDNIPTSIKTRETRTKRKRISSGIRTNVESPLISNQAL